MPPTAATATAIPDHRLPDLHFLHGPAWMTQIAALPATTTYCTRRRDVAFHRPSSFVAHLYARHLYDLENGPGLARGIAAVYGLDNDGLRFLPFEDREPDRLHAHYRWLLSRTPWPTAEHATVRAEFDYARHLYAGILRELAKRWAPTDTACLRHDG